MDATGPITIRLARPADAAGIARVQLASWRSAYAGLLPEAWLEQFTFEEQESDWREIMEWEGSLTYVAETAAGEIAGFAWSRPERDPAAGYAVELAVIHILPEFKRQGIGRRLIHASAEHLRGQGYPSLWLWVIAANSPARAVYERLGGQYVAEKTSMQSRPGIEISVHEVAYGWPDIGALCAATAER